MKNVRINIESTVEEIDEAGLVESSERTATKAIGKLSEDGDKIRISYSETNENVTTSSEIFVSEDTVTVKRSGGLKYEFVFSEGKTTSSLYTVPPYSFDTEIYTRKIRKSIDNGVLEISLIYDMTIGGAKKKTRMKIFVSEE